MRTIGIQERPLVTRTIGRFFYSNRYTGGKFAVHLHAKNRFRYFAHRTSFFDVRQVWGNKNKQNERGVRLIILGRLVQE